ncbi:MAG TPA: hypothetical protein VGH33_03150 [Isosphaeraceae bacterium]
MMPELERLAALARRAEASAKAQKLERETQAAVDRLRQAEERVRVVAQRVADEQPTARRELDEAEKEDKVLGELTQKIAQYRFALDSDSREAEDQIVAARAKIDGKRKDAKARLDEITKAVDEAQRELTVARDKYQGLRKELDRLLPELAERFAEGDQLVSEVELFLPSGQIRGLMAEIEDGATHFGALEAREQKAQLMIWIGKLRRLQSTNASRPQDEIQQLESIFRRLVSLSKQYMPGYIDAFQEGYTADWDLYIADAQEQFRISSEQGRRDRETRQQREDQAAREAARKKVSRESALVAIEDLRAVIATHKIPDDGLDEFNAVLARVVNLGGSSEPELLELVRPFRELITGSDLRTLRKHLDRIQDEEDKLGESAAVRERYRELIALTRGRRALMIGGAVREDARRSLQQTFEFDELEWEPYEGNRPAALNSLEQRVKNRGIDLVLILKNFVGHSVSERLRPLCEENDIPCLMVEHGYGAQQVGETLRAGLLKSA